MEESSSRSFIRPEESLNFSEEEFFVDEEDVQDWLEKSIHKIFTQSDSQEDGSNGIAKID